MSYGSAWEKFHLAVLGLASSPQAPQERLAAAYRCHLMHAERNLPPSTRDDFNNVSEALHRVEATGNEADVRASARALGEVKTRELIELIVSMYDRLAALYGPHVRPRGRS